MKPLKLEISAFGPYKDKELIDFKKVGSKGLFLITGPTGAGKTTIFDAIAYALFGEVSGNIRDKDELRSDFATNGESSYVELTFAHRDIIYSVRRNPKYMRLKRGKTDEYILEKEKAVLSVLEEDTYVVKADGSKEVTDKIHSVIGLDYHQFKQISMIAQGEFQELLIASSKDRTKIFRDIFHTEIYDDMQNIMAKKSKELYIKICALDNKLEEALASVTSDNEDINVFKNQEKPEYEKIIALLKEQNKSDKAAEKSAFNELSQYNAIVKENIEFINNGQHMNEQIDKLKESNDKLNLLIDKNDIMQMEEERYNQGFKYQLVRERELHFESLKKTLEKKEEELNNIDKEAAEMIVHLNQVMVEYVRLNEKEDDLQGYENKILELKEYIRFVNEYNDENNNLSMLQAEYIEAEENATVKRQIYENKDREFKRASAGILAKDLTDNKPCPVCGSLVHPSPAQITEEVPTEIQIKALEQDYVTAMNDASTKNELAVLSNKKVKTMLENLNNLKIANITTSELESKIANTVKLRDDLHQSIDNIKKNYDKYNLETENYKILIIKTENDCNKLKDEIASTEKEFKHFLHANDFESIEEYRLSFIENAELTRLKKEVDSYKTERKSLEDYVTTLNAEVGENKKIDLLEAKERLTIAEQKRAEIINHKEIISGRLKGNLNLISSIEDKFKLRERFAHEYGIIKDLELVSKGNNNKNIIFEQYVLSAYFDDILRAANMRLDTMSNGRYELYRVKEAVSAKSKESLDIVVSDNYTGKNRSVKTLSGGETFKAALSLALGMSDVVQQNAGGIEVDTLFVDEGFGALDMESLEQAIEALTSLTENNKLIGIISHVSELKERIDNQIIIEKTNIGSRIVS